MGFSYTKKQTWSKIFSVTFLLHWHTWWHHCFSDIFDFRLSFTSRNMCGKNQAEIYPRSGVNGFHAEWDIVCPMVLLRSRREPSLVVEQNQEERQLQQPSFLCIITATFTKLAGGNWEMYWFWILLCEIDWIFRAFSTRSNSLEYLVYLARCRKTKKTV